VAVDESCDPDLAAERAWLAGDADALRLAFERFGRLVQTYCVRLVGRHDADDCVQETFVTAWHRRDRFDATRGSLPGWLLGIARFKALDVQRRAARAATNVVALGEQPAAADHATDVANRLLAAHVLEHAQGRPRRILELAYFSDLTHQQIAEVLGVPIGTVKSDLHRAMRRLQVQVTDGGG
jgi:RNA polymerase sigma-70 factor (ECF subfamily)